MNTVIAMQNIRTSLASIAKRAEAGEQFLVVKNSKPSFYIIPATGNKFKEKRPKLTLENITQKIDKSKMLDNFSSKLIDEIIHEIHQESVL